MSTVHVQCMPYLMAMVPPFFDQKQYELLENLIDQELSQNIVLDYNTNWTNVPQKLFEYWKHFKRIDIGGSVDGIGRIDDYIRHPSKWSQIEKNIIKLDRESPDNVNPWITFTLQILNVMEPMTMIEWNIQNKFQKLNRLAKTPWFTQHPVHNLIRHFTLHTILSHHTPPHHSTP